MKPELPLTDLQVPGKAVLEQLQKLGLAYLDTGAMYQPLRWRHCGKGEPLR